MGSLSQACDCSGMVLFCSMTKGLREIGRAVVMRSRDSRAFHVLEAFAKCSPSVAEFPSLRASRSSCSFVCLQVLVSSMPNRALAVAGIGPQPGRCYSMSFSFVVLGSCWE